MTAMYFYKALKERGYRVFYDLAVLRSGSFNEALLHSIRSCTDFVLILSPHALDRCAAPDDWVRAEIAEALRLGKNIIPIMLKDFTFPEYLPEDIDAVRYQNGLTSTTEYFNESINRVCSRYLLSKPVLKKKKSSPVVPILLSIAAVLLLAAALVYWYMDNKKPKEYLQKIAKAVKANNGIDKSILKIQSYDWNKDSWLSSKDFSNQFSILKKAGMKNMGYYPATFLHWK